MSLRIVIPGEPIPWKRPAEKRMGRKFWRFDSQKAEKEVVRFFFSQASKQNGQEGRFFDQQDTFVVNMSFYLPVNKSDPIRKKNAKLWGLEFPNGKPDIDNLAKFYLDCANGILWSDDKTIVESHLKKFYSENPRTIMEIMTKENLDLPKGLVDILGILGPQELKELLGDARKLGEISDEEIESNLGESEKPDKERRMARIALSLREFCKKHLSILSKISNVKLE